MLDDANVAVYRHYYPLGVKRVIASRSNAFIGEVNKFTVIKYPLAPGGNISRLEVERKLLEIVSPHHCIIGLKSFLNTGLYLERAMNGTLAYYLLESGNPPPLTHQRLS
jgi:hypothetical protein